MKQTVGCFGLGNMGLAMATGDGGQGPRGRRLGRLRPRGVRKCRTVTPLPLPSPPSDQYGWAPLLQARGVNCGPVSLDADSQAVGMHMPDGVALPLRVRKPP